MSPQVQINRVEADLREWKAREEHLAKLFSASPTINSALLKERLKGCSLILMIKMLMAIID